MVTYAKFNKQQTTSVFTGYNRFVLSNFNSLNTAQKLNQKNSRNVKRFYKFITGSSLNKVSQTKKNKVKFNYHGLKGLKYTFDRTASLELRLDVALYRSGLFDIRSSFFISKLIRSGKVAVNNRIERNHSRSLKAGDQFSVGFNPQFNLNPKPEVGYLKPIGRVSIKVAHLPKASEQTKNPNQIFTNSNFIF